MTKQENEDSQEPEQLRKMFIGGLDYGTTDDGLKSYYEQWGTIVDVVVMKDPKTKKSRGFGFITYSQSSMVDDAMANRPHKIDGRQVEPKRAIPRDLCGKNEANIRKLFIGGIGKQVTKEDLEEYFGKYGKMTDCAIVVTKDTGEPRGFGFVEYEDVDAADKVILLQDHEIKGRKVDIKKAIARDNGGRNDGRGGGRDNNRDRGGRGGGGGRDNKRNNDFRNGQKNFGGGGGWNNQGNWGGGGNYNNPWSQPGPDRGNWNNNTRNWGGNPDNNPWANNQNQNGFGGQGFNNNNNDMGMGGFGMGGGMGPNNMGGNNMGMGMGGNLGGNGPLNPLVGGMGGNSFGGNGGGGMNYSNFKGGSGGGGGPMRGNFNSSNRPAPYNSGNKGNKGGGGGNRRGGRFN